MPGSPTPTICSAQFGYIAPREGMEKAREAARKSLELNPRLAEGHVALAAIIEAYDWNWADAEREYRTRPGAQPRAAAAHLWYGMFLRDQGRLKEAMPELRRAAQLAPYSVMTSVNLAYGLLAEGNYSAAFEQARRAVRTGARTRPPPPIALLARRPRRRPDRGRRCTFSTRALGMRRTAIPHALSLVACELARLGNARGIPENRLRLEALARERYVSPFDRGKVSMAPRRWRSGPQSLRRGLPPALQRHDLPPQHQRHLRTRDPRFQSLVDKMHFKG